MRAKTRAQLKWLHKLQYNHRCENIDKASVVPLHLSLTCWEFEHVNTHLIGLHMMFNFIANHISRKRSIGSHRLYNTPILLYFRVIYLVGIIFISTGLGDVVILLFDDYAAAWGPNVAIRWASYI